MSRNDKDCICGHDGKNHWYLQIDDEKVKELFCDKCNCKEFEESFESIVKDIRNTSAQPQVEAPKT